MQNRIIIRQLDSREWVVVGMRGDGARFGRTLFRAESFERADAFVAEKFPGARRSADRFNDGSVVWILQEPALS